MTSSKLKFELGLPAKLLLTLRSTNCVLHFFSSPLNTGIHYIYTRNTLHVYQEYNTCIPGIHYMYTRNTLHIYQEYMYTRNTLHIYQEYTTCIPLYNTCIPGIHYMYTKNTCTPGIHYICTTRKP